MMSLKLSWGTWRRDIGLDDDSSSHEHRHERTER